MPLTMVNARAVRREVARRLSGYLCGTHSGVLARRRRAPGDRDELAAMHRTLPDTGAGETLTLGEERWRPAGGAARLARRLEGALAHPAVIDLIVFGSQGRGSTTGFSDVDAILVVDDGAAEEVHALRDLRGHVLAGQRAVFAYQPMQHHGFEVVTPKLLLAANHALAMPAVAVGAGRSLMGRTVEATFVPDDDDFYRAALAKLVRETGASSAWPAHPWHLHLLVSMFELLPALYLQARGEVVAKSQSFARARADFGEAWWPYDVLEEVRERWPRRPAPALNAAAAVTRNPWLALAAWRRLPRRRAPFAGRLTGECLAGLQALGREMLERSRGPG